jgi:hypothetical protein
MEIGLSLLVCATVAAYSGAALYWASLRLYRNGAWFGFVGAVIPLVTVWVFFVLGSFLYNVPVFQRWSAGYTLIDGDILVVLSVITIVGMLAYAVAFHWMRRAVNQIFSRLSISHRPRLLASSLLFVVLAVDWYGRVGSIISGTYVRWLAPTFRESFLASRSDPVFLLLGTTGFVVVGLAFYLRKLAGSKSKRWVLNCLIALQCLLLFSRGSRKEFFFILLIIGTAMAVEHGRHISDWVRVRSVGRRVMVLVSGLAVLWVGIMAVPVARRSLRASVAARPNHPIAMMETFLLRELPASLLLTARARGDYSPAQDIVGRIISYPSFAGAISQSQISDGTNPIGLGDFIHSAEIAVPSFLLSRAKVRPNEVLYEHYSGRLAMSRDPHGHPVTSGIAYLGLAGIILVLVIGGLIAGVSVGALQPFEKLGIYVAIGLLPAFIPFGTDIGAYLSSLRNAVAVVIVLHATNLLIATKLGR